MSIVMELMTCSLQDMIDDGERMGVSFLLWLLAVRFKHLPLFIYPAFCIDIKPANILIVAMADQTSRLWYCICQVMLKSWAIVMVEGFIILSRLLMSLWVQHMSQKD